MESEELARNVSSGQTKQQRDSRDMASVHMVLNAFIFLVIELDFSYKLVNLIRSHAPLWYVTSAAVVQLSLMMAAITYRRIWRILGSTRHSAADTEKLLEKIGYLVMCLLFTLMSYSNFAADAARAKQ